MNESPEDYRSHIAEAKLAFSENENRVKLHAAQIQTFASDAMKAPALVSAAGVAAALGFYSANYARLVATPDGLETFNSILFWLFSSLLFTVCAPGCAYLSQLYYVASLQEQDHSYIQPYLAENAKTRLYERFGTIFRWSAVLLIAVSILCLIRGGFLFLRIVA